MEHTSRGKDELPPHRRAQIARWEAETDALFERMQQPGFLAAALRALEAPLTADLGEVPEEEE
jgi:hypothetical protein